MNRRTFELEAKPDGWAKELRDLLTEDFQMRRANPALPVQSRDAMIEFIATQAPVERSLADESELVWRDSDIGVVVCVVFLPTIPGAAFRNIKLFVRSATWRCQYWQVTKEDRWDESHAR